MGEEPEEISFLQSQCRLASDTTDLFKAPVLVKHVEYIHISKQTQ